MPYASSIPVQAPSIVSRLEIASTFWRGRTNMSAECTARGAAGPEVLLKACRRCPSTLAVRQRSKVGDSCRAAPCVLRLQEVTQGDETDALSDVPNIFATLGNPPVGPPFRSTTDPRLPLLLWVQSFQRQAELEVIHLLRAARATSVSIDGLHL